MTASEWKIRAGDEKSLVKVGRKTTKMLDFQRLDMFLGLSDSNFGLVDDQRR